MNSDEDADVARKETTEFSLTSDDPNERKLARRERIKRRLKEATRLQAIRQGTYVAPDVEKHPLDQEVENSEDVLENLFIEGKEFVSNIRVASDAREVDRRKIESEDKSRRLKILEEEAAAALEKLNEITNRWEVIQDVNDPLDLHEHMKEQKEKCLNLIQQKNNLLKNFQMELKIADEKYMKDRQKMYNDLALLTQRIDEQVLVMKKAYRLEAKNIEDVVDATRCNIIKEYQKIWQTLYNQRESDEVANMRKTFKMVKDHELELDKLHKLYEEKYREARIRLETDIQILEQELERVKALCLMNSEKLDYNYQILKKREEENVYIKNHQKRKLNKLQDIVNTLKKKIGEKQDATELELKKLHQEVIRYQANIMEIEKKAVHFSQMNEDTYQSIWDMKVQEAKGILNKILLIDRIIFEQILGLPWAQPAVKVLDKRDLPSFKSAKKIISELSSKSEVFQYYIDLGEKDLPENKKLEYEKGHRNIMRQILEMIADQAGFLVEEKLGNLLEPLTSEEKTLVRLDNVFTAIGIQTERDVNFMKKAFLPYATCPLCDSGMQSEPNVVSDTFSDRIVGEPVQTVSRTVDLEEGYSNTVTKTKTQSSIRIQEDSGKKGSLDFVKLIRKQQAPDKSSSLQCSITHPLMIEKIYVLNALKDFAVEFHAESCRAVTGVAVQLSKQRNTISRLLSKDDVKKFWERFKLIFPAEQEKFWDALFRGLSRYYSMLQDRHKLSMKVQKIRRQNMELKALLGKYASGEVANSKFFLPQVSNVRKNAVDNQQLQELMTKIRV